MPGETETLPQTCCYSGHISPDLDLTRAINTNSHGPSYSEMGGGVRVGVRGGKRQEEEVLLIHLILCLYSPLSSSCNLNWTVRNEKESVFWHLKNFIKKSINHWPKVHKNKEDERSIEETFTLTFRQKQGTSYSFSGGWHS